MSGERLCGCAHRRRQSVFRNRLKNARVKLHVEAAQPIVWREDGPNDSGAKGKLGGVGIERTGIEARAGSFVLFFKRTQNAVTGRLNRSSSAAGQPRPYPDMSAVLCCYSGYVLRFA